MKLVNLHTGAEIKVGAKVTTFRGEKGVVKSLHPPTESGKSGKVNVKHLADGWEQLYYPVVIGAIFQEGE